MTKPKTKAPPKVYPGVREAMEVFGGASPASEPETGGKYTIEYDCLNCRSLSRVEIRCGGPAPNVAECPRCGCVEAIRRSRVPERTCWTLGSPVATVTQSGANP
jgi:hypothetical protein